MLRIFVSIRIAINSNHSLKLTVLIRSVLWGNTHTDLGPSCPMEEKLLLEMKCKLSVFSKDEECLQPNLFT